MPFFLAAISLEDVFQKIAFTESFSAFSSSLNIAATLATPLSYFLHHRLAAHSALASIADRYSQSFAAERHGISLLLADVRCR